MPEAKTTPLSTRLWRRGRTACLFAAQAAGWRDRPGLILAGIARQRPFAGSSAYARIGRLLGREVAVHVRGAGRIRLRLDLLSDLMIFEELFIERIYPLECVPFVPTVIVDAGAYTGQFTLLAHTAFPMARLVVAEPEPGNHQRLLQCLGENGVSAACHAAAVWVRAGTIAFRGSGFGGHVADRGETATVEVVAVPLAHLLADLGADRLLLKMDIEGAEREVLPSAVPLFPAQTALFLETHHPEQECRGFLAPLLAAGFTDHVIRRRPAPPPAGEYVERLLLRPGPGTPTPG